MKSTQRPCGRLNRWVAVAALAVTGLAVRQELNKPKAERTWHGVVLGWLPYDFRRPTLQRIRDTFWAPEDRRLFMPRVFGLGWDINLGRLLTLLRGRGHDLDRP